MKKNKPGRKKSSSPKKIRVSICLSREAIDRLREIVGSGSASAWIEAKINEGA